MAGESTFPEIKQRILQKEFAPVYLLQGEEPYFVDQLTDLIIEQALDESERDFNQTIVYGLETDAGTVINACKRYPMMAERQLVIVKEAQSMKDLYELVHYVKNPLASTILVINYKYGKADGRKPFTKAVADAGIVYESKKYYENQIPSFIQTYLRERETGIDPKASQLLTDYLGTDISKVTNELDKLIILLTGEKKHITPDLIEQNIGISKDFNNFELQKAIANKDAFKANQIARYFDKNPKNNPFVRTINALFGFFSNLMICQFEPDKSPDNLRQVLGFRTNFQLTDYLSAMRHYKPMNTMQNIALIREYDAKSKGFNNPGTPPGTLLVELLHKLMN